LRVRLREKVLMKDIGKISKRLEMRVAAWVTCSRLNDLLKELQPDVINVHNLHVAGWGPQLVAVCARHAPTVWTLHDMWSFTGRCAYSYDCRKFTSGCNASCPTPAENPVLEPKLIARAWKLRRRLFAEQADLVAACPSGWLAQEALAGFWSSHRVEVIPNGLPLDVYLPLDRALARAALGINSHSPVILAAAQILTERRKGGAILVEVLQKIRNRPLTLITLGHGRLSSLPKGVTSHSLGYVDHERTKVLAYNAADLLVHPAPVDNLPNVVVEAIACGTPCVGFAVGGVPDVVRPGLTGWLAQEITARSLASAIDDALTVIKQGTDLRSSCRAIAEAEYAVQIQAQRYLTLFRSLQQDRCL
jgi:glycosyltransferase involved in cell wall biosynthesis